MSSWSTWSRHRAYEQFVNEEQKLLLQVRVARALFFKGQRGGRSGACAAPPLKQLGAIL